MNPTQTMSGPSVAANTLPQEICELCIDALADTAKDDKRSRIALSQCMLVCGVFWIRARGHIFRDVHILGRRALQDHASVEEQLASLLALMNPNEPMSTFSVATLIKSFTLDTDRFNINQPSFSSILQGFLDAQVLHDLHLKTWLLYWIEMDSSIQGLVRALCQTSHLKTLYLPQILSIPPHIFEGSTIKHFGTLYGDIGDWDALSSPPQLVSFHGHGLVLSNSPTNPNMHTGAVLPFSQLEKLDSFITRKGPEATYALAQRSRGSLHTLHLTFSATSVPITTTFDLTTQLPNLRHLRLGLFVTYRGAAELKHLCRFIAPSSPLQSITIEISHSVLGVPLSSKDQVYCWALERALLQSRVPQVELVVNIGLLEHEGEDTWVSVASKTRTGLERLFSALLRDADINFKITMVPVS